MHLIKADFLANHSIDYDKVIDILSSNGITSLMWTALNRETTPKSLESYVRRTFSKENVSIPDGQFFCLFYNIGSGDFDAAYLYTPDFSRYLINPNPTPEKIENICKGFTKYVPLPLVVIYQIDRFRFPKVSVYECGRMRVRSKDAGTEEYRAEYRSDDEKRILKSIDAFLESDAFRRFFE